MRPSNVSSLPRTLFAFIIVIIIALALAALLARSVLAYRTATRGIEYRATASQPALGVNISLLDVSDTDLARQLDAARAAGQGWLRQRVAWADVEPTPGVYQWAALDRLIAAAQTRGLHVIATLTDAPAWARAPEEQKTRTAPPADPADYARFVDAFTRRYQGRVSAVQIWDSPNLASQANGEFIPARRYVALLKAAYLAIKAVDPGMTVLGGGLGATNENSTRNQSDVTYLEWIYRAGGGPYFDAVAIKPYGFWTGPEDRQTNEATLNFSRAILLHEVMARYGDAAKALWAVEWGWNALPPDWTGRPSPWGSDDTALQAQRSGDALRRARAEWPWLTGLVLMHLRPTVAADDPVWGFTLLDQLLQPLPALGAVQAAAIESITPAQRPNVVTTWGLWLALAVGSGVAAWTALVAAWRLPWGDAWRWWDTTVARLGERGNVVLLAGVTALFALLPWPLNAVMLPILALLLARRLDLALAGIALTAPFFLKPVRFGSAQFALVEVLTILTFAAWLVKTIVGLVWLPRPMGESRSEGFISKPSAKDPHPNPLPWGEGIRAFIAPLTLIDLSVLMLLILGATSPFIALLPGVASREFRTVILEPVLFYVVLRGTPLGRRELLRLADAFVLAGVGLALYGFLTYREAGGIAAEGVLRLRSVYGSPNNLALTLGRLVPILLSLMIWGSSRTRRWLYALALVPILIALFMTFSTGAWLIGVPAALIFLGLFQGRRALAWSLGVIGVGVLALLPFASTERVGRLLRIGDAQTLAWRTLLWQSAINMIRDHPWFGVGLDNFLYEYRDTYILPDALADRNLSHPHNLMLDFWTRLGIFAVAALILGQVAFFRASLQLWRTLGGDLRILVLGLMASMVNFLAHGMVDNSLFLVDLAFIYMLTIGIIRNLERYRGA